MERAMHQPADAATKHTLTVASDILQRYAARKRELLAQRHGGLPSFPEPTSTYRKPLGMASTTDVSRTDWRDSTLTLPRTCNGSAASTLFLVPPPTCTPEPEGELVEENRRLRREVGSLRRRLQEAEATRSSEAADAENVAAELRQLRCWVSCFQRHVLPHTEGRLSRQYGASLCSMPCDGNGASGLDDSVPQHLRSMMTESRYSDVHEAYFPPEAGMHAVKREVEELKRELRLLRAVVDGAMAGGGGGASTHQHRSSGVTRAREGSEGVLVEAGAHHRRMSDPSFAETRVGGWSSVCGSNEVSILQEQVCSLEGRLQRARQEEFRVGQQASEAVVTAIAARRELAGLKGLATRSDTDHSPPKSPHRL